MRYTFFPWRKFEVGICKSYVSSIMQFSLKTHLRVTLMPIFSIICRYYLLINFFSRRPPSILFSTSEWEGLGCSPPCCPSAARRGSSYFRTLWWIFRNAGFLTRFTQRGISIKPFNLTWWYFYQRVFKLHSWNWYMSM